MRDWFYVVQGTVQQVKRLWQDTQHHKIQDRILPIYSIMRIPSCHMHPGESNDWVDEKTNKLLNIGNEST